MSPSNLRPFRFFTLACLLFAIPAHAQYWNWQTDEQLANSGSTCYPQATAVDDAGNVFVTGSFMGTVTIGASSLTGGGGGDMYLVKYSPSGSPLWTVGFGASTTWNEKAYTIATDTSGNVYVGGHTPDPFSVGSVNVNPSAGRGFILKFDASGTCLWSRMLGSTSGTISPQKMIYDRAGNKLIAAGTYWQAGTFGSINLTGNGAQDTYVTSIDPATGGVAWATNVATSSGTDVISGLTLDNWGNIFLTGSFGSSTVTIGNQVLGFSNAGWFAAKFRSSGAYVNCFTSLYMDFAGAGFGTATGLIYTAGRYYEAFSQGMITLPHLGQNMQGDVFVCAFDTLLQPLFYSSANGPGNDFVHAMLVDSGNIYLTLEAGGQMVCQSHMLNSTGQNYGMVYVKLNQGLQFQWSRAINGSYFSNKLTALASGGGYLYMAGTYRGTITFDNGNQTILTLSSPPNSTGFLVQLSDVQLIETGGITGHVFSDVDADGIIDSSETTFFNQLLLISQPGNSYSATDSYGHYSYSVLPGMQQLDLVSIPLYYNQVFPASQQSQFVNVPSFTVRDSVNFGLQPIPGIQDLELTLTGLPSLRSGNNTRYYIDYINRGTDTMSGYVRLQLDTQLAFLQSTPPPDSIAGNEVYWDYYGLIPLATGHISIDCGVSLFSPLNGAVYNFSVIEPVPGDSTPPNNYDTTRQIITGPYDPNMKEVSPEGAITPSDVANGIWLEYVLHFQNVGTDTAFDVVIRDTLSNLLDIATLQVTGSSAAVEWSLGSNLELVFRFDSILLPDSSVNQLGSNGYVRYRVKPLSTVIAGQQIDNTCFIFFDYNMPVQTNTTQTPVQVMTTVAANPPEQQVILYPNPASDQFIVESTENIYSISIFDVAGREIKSFSVGNNINRVLIPVPDIPPGIFIVKVLTGAGIIYSQVIITGP